MKAGEEGDAGKDVGPGSGELPQDLVPGKCHLLKEDNKTKMRLYEPRKET